MTANHDNLVRQALELLASRAVDPDRILAALPARRARYRRNRRLGAVTVFAVAVAVAGAIAVPAFALHGGRDGGVQRVAGPLTSSGQPSASQSPAGGGAEVSVPLRFGVGWLPKGFVERRRWADLGAGLVERSWTAAATASGEGDRKTDSRLLELSVSLTGRGQAGDAGGNVDINGKRGVYISSSTTSTGSDLPRVSSVVWAADADTVLSLRQTEARLSQAEMLMIARSVRPDSASLTVPLRIGWLPDGAKTSSVVIEGRAATMWQAVVTVGGPRAEPTGSPTAGADGMPAPAFAAHIGIGTETSAPDGGEKATVGGRSARLVATGGGTGDKSLCLVVELANHLLLTVTDRTTTPQDALTRDEMIKIAESVAVDGEPDSAWIGQ